MKQNSVLILLSVNLMVKSPSALGETCSFFLISCQGFSNAILLTFPKTRCDKVITLCSADESMGWSILADSTMERFHKFLLHSHLNAITEDLHFIFKHTNKSLLQTCCCRPRQNDDQSSKHYTKYIVSYKLFQPVLMPYLSEDSGRQTLKI